MRTQLKHQVHIGLVIICIVLLLWVGILGWLGRRYEYVDLWAFSLVGAAFIVFFGFALLPGTVQEDGSFSESRLRLALCATILVVYLVYFASTVYLNPTFTKEGKELKTFAADMLPTLTNLLSITLAFYFGSSAVSAVAGKREKQAPAESSTRAGQGGA
jgi:hypothetical protein